MDGTSGMKIDQSNLRVKMMSQRAKRPKLMGGHFLTAVLAVFVVCLFALPQTAQAQPTKIGSKRCGQCHSGEPAAGSAAYFAVDGVEGASPTVAPGTTIEVDWIYTLLRGYTPTRGVVGHIGLPAGWTIAATTNASNPATLNGQAWNTNWDNASSIGGATDPGWLTGVAETAGAWTFVSNNVFTQSFEGTAYENGSGSAFDDGSAGDLDGVVDVMGADARITIPGGEADGAYTIYVAGIGHGLSIKSMTYAAVTINVSSGGDTTPPSVTTTIPTNGATSVALDSLVTINFDENVNCATVNTTNITSDSPGWTFNNCNAAQASFTTSGQGNGTTYNVSVTAAVTDVAGNPLNAAPYNFSYTTLAGDVTQPNVSSTVPTNGAIDTALDAQVTINFDENVDCVTVTTVNITSDNPIWNLNNCSGSTAVFNTSGQANSITYNVSVTGAVTDVAGNPLNAAPYNFSYTTIASGNAPPANPPQVSFNQFESDGITGVNAGNFTADSTLVLKGTVTDPDGDTVQLQVEIQPIASPFSNSPNCTSAAAAASGSTCEATCGPLGDGLYKWQARGRDTVNGTNSAWVQY
jgi:protocatechuate 3,4-dioxygenase beta subunit